MGSFIANIQNALAPILGQPNAQSRIGKTPIYSGTGGEDLGSTFKQPFSPSSYITIPPDVQQGDQGPTILKHEIIHSLSNKYGIDPTKLDFQDPPGHTFKGNLDPKEWISYALAGPGTSPEVQSAMQKAIQSSKSIPQRFKDALGQLGVLGMPQTQQFQPPPGFVPDNSVGPQAQKFKAPPGFIPDNSAEVAKQAQQGGGQTPLKPEEVAPYFGKMVAQLPPMLGSFLGPEGTALGSVVSQGMKAAAPSVFGQPPQSITDYAKSLGVDLLANEGIPRALGWVGKAIGRNLPAVKEGTANLLTKNIQSQYSARPESAIVEDMAGQFNKGTPGRNPNFPNVPPATPGGAPLENNPVGQMLQRVKSDMSLPPDVARTQEISKIANTTFSDLKHVQNAKLVADPDSIAELGYKKLLGNEGPINAKGILKELAGDKAEVWQEGLGPNLPAFKDAMGEIAKQQETGPAGRLLNYAGHHLIWTGIATGGAGLLTHSAIPTAVAGGAVLSNVAFSKLMASPKWAPIVVAALKTPSSAAEAPLINQFLDAAIKSVGGAGIAAAKQ